MNKINPAVLKELGLDMTPGQYIAKQLKALPENTALTAVIDQTRTGGSGYLVAIATKDQSGYNPTSIILNESNYNTCSEWVDEANKLIYKGRNKGETYKIVLSSMKRK